MKFHSTIGGALFYAVIAGALWIGGTSYARATETQPCPAQSESENPRFSQSVAIPTGSREQFFEAIRAFSAKNDFAYRIAPSNPGTGSYLVQLWRDDIKLVAVNSLTPTEFTYYIYDTCSCGPSLPQSQLLAVAGELRQAISQVKSAKFKD